MRFFSQFVWLSGVFVMGVILVRSVLGKSLARYPLFYAYIASVLFTSASFYVSTSLYMRFYWTMQFVTLSLGCGVIFEISRKAFAQHVSLDRFVRWIMAIAFGVIFFSAAVHAFFLPHWSLVRDTADLERDLRLAQAAALLAIVFLTQYYGIEIGKNMKGMILGFGVYVGASIISLTMQVFVGNRFMPAWVVIQPSSYLATLLIWMFALWSYARVPEGLSGPTDADYQGLTGRTRQVLGSIQQHLDRTPQR